jgi:hypothetical protein
MITIALTRTSFWVGLLLTASMVTGCNGLPDLSARWEGGSTGYTNVTPKGEVNYALAHLKYNKQIYFVLLAKNASGGSIGGDGPKQVGSLMAPNNGPELVKWSCESKDGKGGIVRIGPNQFGLEKGGLFLVNADNGKLTVEQMAIDMSQLQAGDLGMKLKEMASSNPKLAKFTQDFQPQAIGSPQVAPSPKPSP